MHVDAWLPRAARAHPDRQAVNGLTFADLHAAALRTAAGLDGVAPGERVAIALPPGDDFAVALHAIWLRGAVAVPHDLRLTDAERPSADHVVGAGPLPSADPAGFVAASRHDLSATAAIIQTSGTSGAPKPVELTFGNWLWSALGGATALRSPGPERWLCALPLSHVGGLSILVRGVITGSAALVHERWDTARVVRALMEDDVSLVSVVPTTLARLLDAGLTAPPALRCALVGGGPVAPDLLRRAAAAGVPVAQTYGLTETCSQVTTQQPGDDRPDAGAPLFCTRVRVAGDGEIHVRGLTVAGDDPALELATGDLGVLDGDGRLTVVGRKADTIVTGGENVAPTEVEAVLAEHPAVAEAAVLGRPDPEWGEAVHARVVLRAGMSADAAGLRAHCAARLARFKVPKDVVVVDTLPRTTSGKLRRRDLR
ncbi:2-succinylbenzoate--CoA ligase [Paraconexibacter sp. AEG42_29]|uniref:2-succinylbenzoate--CoA ligase n=1 Tax=Paraconexibacter sp. AEG42_29 TaxID=2997339 RepID=A0AAU7AVK3_9ACTN